MQLKFAEKYALQNQKNTCSRIILILSGWKCRIARQPANFALQHAHRTSDHACSASCVTHTCIFTFLYFLLLHVFCVFEFLNFCSFAFLYLHVFVFLYAYVHIFIFLRSDAHLLYCVALTLCLLHCVTHGTHHPHNLVIMVCSGLPWVRRSVGRKVSPDIDFYPGDGGQPASSPMMDHLSNTLTCPPDVDF